MKRVARRASALALTLALGLTACGGGGGGSTDPGVSGDLDPPSCDLPVRKRWMDDYFARWYLWNEERPVAPDPSGSDAIEAYFSALLHTAGSATPYKDRWSYIESSAAFDQFYNQGKTLGYGLSVAGRMEDPVPVRVRYVAPGSPADLAGLRRGMVVVSIDGEAAESYRRSDNAGFTPLTPADVGSVLRLQVKDSPASSTLREVSLMALAYTMTPVDTVQVLNSPGGRKFGYLHFMSFIDPARNPLNAALARLRDEGVADVALDLRYNGGGLVSMARDLASSFAGSDHNGQRFARTQFNRLKSAGNDRDYNFAQSLAAVPRTRLYVLTGPRTCSASELVINGLRGLDGIEVVQVGTTTCGKPFGFSPRNDQCGSTLNVVNFSMVNARGEGGYVDGLVPQCVVADDFDHALGDGAEALLAGAMRHADTGSCTSRSVRALPASPGPAGGWTRDGDERQGQF